MDTYIGDTNIETMYKRSRRAAKDLIFPRCSDCTLVGLHCTATVLLVHLLVSTGSFCVIS